MSKGIWLSTAERSAFTVAFIFLIFLFALSRKFISFLTLKIPSFDDTD